MAYNPTAIEKKWQKYWLENKSFRALDPEEAGGMAKAYILDMFPYPSGAGLHVGHPEGYTATDIVSRFLRMRGLNVLHPMGWDAFGLPAEQYAIKSNTHPRLTTQTNIARFREQIQMLGLSYDWDREVDTTDPQYYRWTQWIFLQLFNSYFDPIDQKAKPIGRLIKELQNENLVVAPDGSVHLNQTSEGLEEVAGEVRIERLWREMSAEEQRDIIDGQRLAYMDEIPVNWCPGLGTVLANEEVIDGKSDIGGFPVERRPMRQWMLRITAYADRLIDDLQSLDWPESLKEMQRNWIGKSVGAEVDFDIVATEGQGSEATAIDTGEVEDDGLEITVFTTRPDTLYGATYLVLAPEHPLVDRIVTAAQRAAVEAYRQAIAGKSDRERMADAREKTGVFTGAYATNPMNDEKIPIWISDYVLMGYGTGAIMAVPAHDERDFEFARKFGLPIRAVVLPDDAWMTQQALIFSREDHGAGIRPAGLTSVATEGSDEPARDGLAGRTKNINEENLAVLRAAYLSNPVQWGAAFTGEGIAVNSPLIDGLETAQAKEKITEYLDAEGVGIKSVKYKLRDWLFSRQRYWGEPFPIVLDAEGNAYDLPESQLPLTLPEMEDFKPTGTPEGPLSKAKQWLEYTDDRGTFTRETNTMPQWAGSCWYYLRYIDPHNTQRFVDPAKEKYWMPVDLYVGGVEHAVLHLLYARFLHKILFDLGHVSTPEPFQRLVNQGTILGEMEYHAFADAGGNNVTISDVRDLDEESTSEGTRLVGIQRSTGQQVIGRRLTEEEVEKAGEGYRLKSDAGIRVDARSFKMSKSRRNVVNPDPIVAEYGADTLRLYEMYMGPLEAQKPWNTRDIVGMARFLSSVWRIFIGDEETSGAKNRIIDDPIPPELDRRMHRAIKKVTDDITAMRFNTAIAELIELKNAMIALPGISRELAENYVLLLAPFAPHIAEELWERLGHHKSLSRRPWPTWDQAKLIEASIDLPIQVNGKLRGRVTVASEASEDDVFSAAQAAESVKPWLEGKAVAKRIYVPGKLVSFVVGK